mgnify:CR=1 FL=1
MEEYINENTIIKNEVYEIIKEDLYCQACKNLMIQNYLCLVCQNHFCKNCYEKSMKNDGEFVHKCENASFIDVKDNKIIKCKFKCIKGCNENISYDNIKEHYSSDCLSRKNKAKAMTPGEAAEYRKKYDEDIPQIKSM